MPRYLGRNTTFSASKRSNRPATDHVYLHHGATIGWRDVTSNNLINHLNPWAIATHMVEQIPRTAVLPLIDYVVGEVLRDMLESTSARVFLEQTVSMYVFMGTEMEMLISKTVSKRIDW